jgi:hypothetical protein
MADLAVRHPPLLRTAPPLWLQINGEGQLSIRDPHEAPLADLTPITGMSLAFVGESSQDLRSEPESPTDQDLPESDINTSLATVWATLKITKPTIIVALKERVIRYLDNALEHNQDVNPTTAEYNEMARDMATHEGMRYIEKRHAWSLGMASIMSSHPSMVPERIQWTS